MRHPFRIPEDRWQTGSIALIAWALCLIVAPASGQTVNMPSPMIEAERNQADTTGVLAEPAMDTPEVYCARIEALIVQNRWDEASAMLDVALALFPEHKGLQYELAFFFWLKALRAVLVYAALAFSIAIIIFGLFIGLTVQRHPLLAARIYVFGVYMLTIPVALVILLVSYPVISMQNASQGLGDGITHISLVAIACFLGAVSGTIRSSFELARHKDGDMPEKGLFTTIFFKPINGFFLAAVMYIALMSGQLALSGTMSMSSPWIVALLAILTGLFSDRALEQLQKIGGSVFSGAALKQPAAAQPPFLYMPVAALPKGMASDAWRPGTDQPDFRTDTLDWPGDAPNDEEPPPPYQDSEGASG